MVAMTDELGDEVSMTKITDRPDQAAVGAKVLDLEVSRAVHFQALPPLHHHGALPSQLFEAEVAQLAAVLDPVEVDVSKLSATRVAAGQLEGRTGARRIAPGAASHAADGCL